MNREDYMRRAISLAKRGMGFTNPNPMVGAVIVKDGRIIGEGWHERYGELHAERNALSRLTESAENAELYVTLEPCCHYGKQPPCTEAVMKSGIKTVYVGSSDPNPLVAGKGVRILREAGITVITDFLKEECDALNPVFFHYITKKRPYMVLKYAMTMDGKLATVTGASKWITGEEARAEVQTLRGHYAAIMVGIGTVLQDDPMLNARGEGLHSPLRVIVDSGLRIPLESRICNTAGEYPTIVAYASADPAKEESLQKCGITLLKLPGPDGRVDLPALVRRLGEMGIDSVLAEGGGTLNDSLREHGLIDRAEVYIAPKIFGGAALSPVSGKGVREVGEAFSMKLSNVGRIGDDIHLTFVR